MVGFLGRAVAVGAGVGSEADGGGGGTGLNFRARRSGSSSASSTMIVSSRSVICSAEGVAEREEFLLVSDAVTKEIGGGTGVAIGDGGVGGANCCCCSVAVISDVVVTSASEGARESVDNIWDGTSASAF